MTDAHITEAAPSVEPIIKVTPHAIFQWRVTVALENYSDGYMLYWGDDTRPATVAAGGAVSHPYPSFPAGWQIRATKADGKTLITNQLCVMRGGTGAHGYSIGRNPDNTAEVVITFEDPQDGTGVLPKFAIEWPKTKDSIIVWGVPGEQVSRIMPYGDHTVSITDLTSHRAANEQVHVTPPDYDPDFTFRRKPGGDNLTAEIEITKYTAGNQFAIGWDEEGSAVEYHDDVKVGDKFHHTYKQPGENETTRHFVTAGYADGSGEPKTVDIRVPLS